MFPSVGPALKSNFYMDGAVASLGEGEVRHVAPQPEGLSDLLVHVLRRDDRGVRVARHSVRQGQRSPAAEKYIVSLWPCREVRREE